MKTTRKMIIDYFRQLICRVMTNPFPKSSRVFLKNDGFTLIELIMVVILVAVLATMSLGFYTNLKTNAKNGRCKAEIRTIEKSVLAFFTDRGSLPNLLSDVGSAANIRDPWGHNYQYYNIETSTGGPPSQYEDSLTMPLNDNFDLYSLGADNDSSYVIPADPDAIDPSNDDIILIRNGSNVVVGKEY